MQPATRICAFRQTRTPSMAIFQPHPQATVLETFNKTTIPNCFVQYQRTQHNFRRDNGECTAIETTCTNWRNLVGRVSKDK